MEQWHEGNRVRDNSMLRTGSADQSAITTHGYLLHGDSRPLIGIFRSNTDEQGRCGERAVRPLAQS